MFVLLHTEWFARFKRGSLINVAWIKNEDAIRKYLKSFTNEGLFSSYMLLNESMITQYRIKINRGK